MTLQSLIDKPKELFDYIESLLKPTTHEKKIYGQVFTPMKLIDEMLDKLNEAYIITNKKSIFTNKHLKWYDPANGMGNFPVAIYYRLMNGLEKEISNKEERKKHILENMLYMSELLEKDIFICNQIFDIDKKYKLNLYCGDTLLFNPLTYWKIDKFDVIIGNPPYQETDDKSKTKGGTNLYTKFINYSFDYLKEDGFLVFINPISFIGPSTNKQMGGDILHNIFLKYDLYYMNMNECKKYFNVGSTFAYYVIQKRISELETEIVSMYNSVVEKNKINIKKYFDLKFLPIHITNNTLSLIKDITNKKNKLDIERCRTLDTSSKKGKEHLSLKQDEKFKYITYHTTSKTYYSDIKLDIYEDYKILLNMAGYLKPILLNNCNITESKFYILVNEDESDKLLKLLESNEIKEYLKLCKYSGFNSRIVIESITY